MWKIEGPDVRDGSEFRLLRKPTQAQASTFSVLHDGGLYVTRKPTDVLSLFGDRPNLPVLAHWHGEYRTDGFALTVGELSQLVTNWTKEGVYHV